MKGLHHNFLDLELEVLSKDDFLQSKPAMLEDSSILPAFLESGIALGPADTKKIRI